MMRIKQYKTAFVIPSDEEIAQGIEIAKCDQCIVRIHYFLPYSGYYHLDIDPQSTLEECQRRVRIGADN